MIEPIKLFEGDAVQVTLTAVDAAGLELVIEYLPGLELVRHP